MPEAARQPLNGLRSSVSPQPFHCLQDNAEEMPTSHPHNKVENSTIGRDLIQYAAPAGVIIFVSQFAGIYAVTAVCLTALAIAYMFSPGNREVAVARASASSAAGAFIWALISRNEQIPVIVHPESIIAKGAPYKSATENLSPANLRPIWNRADPPYVAIQCLLPAGSEMAASWLAGVKSQEGKPKLRKPNRREFPESAFSSGTVAQSSSNLGKAAQKPAVSGTVNALVSGTDGEELQSNAKAEAEADKLAEGAKQVSKVEIEGVCRGDKVVYGGTISGHSVPDLCYHHKGVTRDEYNKCVANRKCTPAMDNVRIDGEEIKGFCGGTYMTCIDRNQAVDYCKSLDMRLPTYWEHKWAVRADAFFGLDSEAAWEWTKNLDTRGKGIILGGTSITSRKIDVKDRHSDLGFRCVALKGF